MNNSEVVTASVNDRGRTTLRESVAVAKRATCTPVSAKNAGVDDVPAIAAAIKSCGNGGIIVIPASTTYAIRSVLSFAGCLSFAITEL